MFERLKPKNIVERVITKKQVPNWAISVTDEYIEQVWCTKTSSATLDVSSLKDRMQRANFKEESHWEFNINSLISSYSSIGFIVKTESHRNELSMFVTQP